MRRPIRRQFTEASTEELQWLKAEPGHNPFIGFDRSKAERFRALWAAYGQAIVAAWGRAWPTPLPFGHPAEKGSTTHERAASNAAD